MYDDVAPIAPSTVERTQLPTTQGFGREPAVDKKIMVASFTAAAEAITALTKDGPALQFDFVTDTHPSFRDTGADDTKLKNKARRNVRDALARGLKEVGVNYKEFSTSFRFHVATDETTGEVVSDGVTVFVYRS